MWDDFRNRMCSDSCMFSIPSVGRDVNELSWAMLGQAQAIEA